MSFGGRFGDDDGPGPSPGNLTELTLDLQRKIVELAECEVAEHQARIEGYMNSPEQSHAGRERDADYHASNWHVERLRVKAQVEVARLERETTMTLLSLGLPL